MNNSSKLSGLELEMMSVIWKQEGAVSVRQVLEQAYPNGEKAYTTVQTVMNNLVEKGYLEKQKIGLANFYSVCKDKGETLISETQNFIQRTFKGSFSTMLGMMIDADALSDKDLKKIRAMITAKEKEEES